MAKKLFPERSKAQAVEALWEAILAASRVTDDPLAAWQAHNDDLHRRCDYLNAPSSCTRPNKCHKLPTTAAYKSPPQSVIYSEAASGLLTGYQGTDAGASLPGSLYRVRL